MATFGTDAAASQDAAAKVGAWSGCQTRERLLGRVPALVGLVSFSTSAGPSPASTPAAFFYGLVDEPAHFATCAVALCLVALSGREWSRTFVVAALVAGVAIDLDHVPQHLGLDFLTAGTSRPYLHCASAS